MSDFKSLSSNGIVFDERPDSIPYNYRISYRIAVICLIIRICSPSKGCPLVKLHILSAALDDDKLVLNIKRDLKLNNNELVIRFDPAINRAIEYAVSEKIIIQQGNKTYKLSRDGRDFADEIIKDHNILVNEKKSLERIKQDLDEITICNILERWRA